MNYLADPGGRFSSDTHRRVLGHLSYPHDEYGWTAQALLERMRPDVGTNISTAEEMESILEDLEKEGHAQQHPGGVWQMTESGFETLTGPIANEPDAGEISGPATVGAASTINGNGNAPAEPSEPAGSSPAGGTQ